MIPILGDAAAGPVIVFVLGAYVCGGLFLAAAVVFVGLRIARRVRGSQPPQSPDTESEP